MTSSSTCTGAFASMSRVERRIDPVLRPLSDRVLFPKHNLDARALGVIAEQLTAVSADVDARWPTCRPRSGKRIPT